MVLRKYRGVSFSEIEAILKAEELKLTVLEPTALKDYFFRHTWIEMGCEDTRRILVQHLGQAPERYYPTTRHGMAVFYYAEYDSAESDRAEISGVVTLEKGRLVERVKITVAQP